MENFAQNLFPLLVHFSDDNNRSITRELKVKMKSETLPVSLRVNVINTASCFPFEQLLIGSD